MALAADHAWNIVVNDNDIQEYAAITNDIFYVGALVGDNGSGAARPLAAADPFWGIVHPVQLDMTGVTANSKKVRVATRGTITNVAAITGASGLGDIGDLVYASDDGTLTKTSSSNSLIGRIANYDATLGVFHVYFESIIFRHS